MIRYRGIRSIIYVVHILRVEGPTTCNNYIGWHLLSPKSETKDYDPKQNKLDKYNKGFNTIIHM